MKRSFLNPLLIIPLLFSYHFVTAQSETYSHLYLDPGDHKNHALIDAKIEGGQLRLSVSAIAPGVDLLPGYESRFNANIQTAYEIDQLFLTDRLQVRTHNASNRSFPLGKLIPDARGSLPIRRLGYDGQINYLCHTEQAYLLGFITTSPMLSKGNYTTEIWARGEPRFRIEYVVAAGGSGEIVQFTEFTHQDEFPSNAGELFQYVTTDPDGEDAYIAPITSKQWQKRDLEAKWVWYKKSVADGEATIKNWVIFLEKEKDFEFLELIGLYQIDAFNHHGIGQVLSRNDAPNWLRLVDWVRGKESVPRGYGVPAHDGLLMNPKTKDSVYSWINKHELQSRYPAVLENLKDQEAKTIDVQTYQKPHLESDILKQLEDIPDEVLTLSPKELSADPNATYLHQVLRAIDGMITANCIELPVVVSRLKTLKNHPHERIRQAVYLAYTHFSAKNIPLNLMQVVNNEQETSLVREAALMAHTYRYHPEIYSNLLNIANSPEHPAWKAAISRLGDIGDDYAKNLISKLGNLNEEQLLHTTSTTKQISTNSKARSDRSINEYRNLLMRATWMQHHKLSHAETYWNWLKTQINAEDETLKNKLYKKLHKETFVSQSPRTDQKRIELSVELTLQLRELVKELE